MESRHAPVIEHRVATGYSHAIQVLGCDEPGKTELDPDTLAGAVLVVDDVDLVCQTGVVASWGLDRGIIDATLGQVLRGEQRGRSVPTQITLYAPVGLPWQDLAVAWSAHEVAGTATPARTWSCCRDPRCARKSSHRPGWETDHVSTVSINGITVGYDDEGSGEPMMLVHGHPFNRSMWRRQMDHFSRSGWRVIAPDLRGYGESTVVGGTVTLKTFARDLAELLSHLDVDGVVLGGLSMGGQIVMEFHRLFPHRVRGLLLADTTSAAETENGKRLRRDTAERLLREGMSAYADEVLPKMLARHNIRALPAVAEHVLGMMYATSPEGAAAALRGRAERRDYVETLAHIAVPTLVVVGRDDEFTPIRDAQLMHARIPNSTLAVIDGAGHLPNLERPTEFNVALQHLLDSLGVRESEKR